MTRPAALFALAICPDLAVEIQELRQQRNAARMNYERAAASLHDAHKDAARLAIMLRACISHLPNDLTVAVVEVLQKHRDRIFSGRLDADIADPTDDGAHVPTTLTAPDLDATSDAVITGPIGSLTSRGEDGTQPEGSSAAQAGGTA